MKKSKRIFTLTLAILIIVISAVPAYGATVNLVPRDGNFRARDAEFAISDSGLAEVTVWYEGYSYTTWATISIKLERWTVFGWAEVENGCLNNTYVAEMSGTSGSVQYTLQLERKGQYRATVGYAIYGTGGYEPDFVTDIVEYEY